MVTCTPKRAKIEAYSHQELNTSKIKKQIKNNINKNVDPFSRSVLKKVKIDKSYPKYLLENIEKYKHFIK